MDIKFYNTLSHKKEDFKPLVKGKVSIYACGPTVYDALHVGNYRTFVMDDILRRTLEYNDLKVTLAMNITDVDDKTIRKSREQGVPLKDITLKYEQEFLEGLKSLHIKEPHKLLRASDHVDKMIALIEKLLEKEIAYKANDGIYIHIDKINDYGALANLDKIKITRERIANDEYDKDNPRDFTVWKFKTAEDGDVYWDAPFGTGRPGWHIECSAMAMKIFGPTIDMHTGGNDLIFPHHTNEIAQSESVTGKQYVRYWLHGGFMTMNDEKMAKSKGNIIKLDDLSAASISPLTFRYWLLTANYRSPINFTLEAAKAAQTALIRLMNIVREYPEGGSIQPQYTARFKSHLNDDLDTPGAIAVVWELLKDHQISDADKRATILDFDKVLGFDLSSLPKSNKEEIPEEIRALAEARELARKENDWAKADALRQEIVSRGYQVNDTEEGHEIRLVD